MKFTTAEQIKEIIENQIEAYRNLWDLYSDSDAIEDEQWAKKYFASSETLKRLLDYINYLEEK